MKEGNRSDIESETEALSNASASMSERLLCAKERSGCPSEVAFFNLARLWLQSKGGNDNVVDAEFEEVKDEDRKK